MVPNDCVVKILILTLVIWSINGFNLSPRPNQCFREPKSKAAMAQIQSSYFGFTINLRGSSVIVGAPRAQSTLRSQQTLNETGAIYKCTIATGTCSPFIFDDTGNMDAQDEVNIFDSEKKDNQWLGASMDGGPKDTDKLVVCAPRLIANFENEYFMHGICYWTPDTLSDKPPWVKKIASLRLQSMKYILNKVREKRPYYMFGEQGLSVHVKDNNEEIIIGTPGIYDWKGSVIRYHPKSDDDHLQMSRRDLNKHRVNRQAKKIIYTTEVPNPDTWKQDSNSYFGYSVGSGYFDSVLPNKIYNVASAPQANHQSGEVYIFDIIKDENGTDSIKKLCVFRGSQLGEYFGYAVLGEDFNGDGLTDLIITSPLYSSDGYVEQGAMYVFINKGRFAFELQKIIKSPVEGIGRFGSAISKLGDINHDGFNDIAVGAPFAGNGTVFIYLGSLKGLREVSSQQLSPGPIATSWGSSAMFGHGLSKGSDIDDNGFNDLAIGAPNAESIFVHRAYPVVKIHATIDFLSREIATDQKRFQIKVCYRISTESKDIQSQDIAIRLNADLKVKSITFQQTNSNEMTFNATVGTDNQCRSLDANVRIITVDIFKPIQLKMQYDLINGVPNSEEFCNECAAVDPVDPKFITTKMIFATECKADICIADLKVTSSGLSPAYILGSNMTISITYEVSNSGETAYLPQINITSSNKMPFNKIPSSCDQRENVLLCVLNRRQSMLKNSKENITIVYDVSQIEGSSINLTAAVFNIGKELNPSDNVVNDFIVLKEFTEIEVNGKTNTSNINLNEVFSSTEIIYNYEIKSNGPSKIEELEITFELPIAHKSNGLTRPVPVIDVNSITVNGSYNGEQLFAEIYQEDILLMLNSSEMSISTKQTMNSQDGKQIIHQLRKKNVVQFKKNTETTRRRLHITEQVAPNNDYIKTAQKNLHKFLSKEQMGSLRINRTIVFSCIDPETVKCVRAVVKINNFIPGIPINITLKYQVELKEVNKILLKPYEFFVIIPKLDIVKLGGLDGNTSHITRKVIYNVIFKHPLINIPWWVIFLGIFCGLLLFAAIVYGMYKNDFFRRNTKEEMHRLSKEQQNAKIKGKET